MLHPLICSCTYLYSILINIPCFCLILGIQRYEANGEPNNFFPIHDGFVGAANLFTVSRKRLGRLTGTCGYLAVNFSVSISDTDRLSLCVSNAISAESSRSISSP